MDILSSLKCNDELECIRQIFDEPIHKFCEHFTYELISKAVKQEEEEEDTYDDMTLASQRMREEGNRLFNAKLAKRDVLGACRLYTRAILAAPEDSATLALAHANRAMALQEFGYFRQAYDDCVCALELGYPGHLRPKIVARQATCALHLGEVAHVRRHLDELNAMPLKGTFPNMVRELREKLAELLRQQRSVKAVEGQLAVAKEERLALQKRQTIVQTAGPAGRFMVATRPIGQHELIFSDYAASFVPYKGEMPCQQCGLKEIIPFPCKRCRGRVVYCSSKCQAVHARIHAFECAGYRLHLFEEMPVDCRLAFRMLLDGLPQAIPLLRHKRNAHALWVALVGKDGGSIAANDSIAYAQILRLVHHLDSMDKTKLLNYMANVYSLLQYLKKYTGFFKLTEGTAATRRDWELLIAALILRHIGQVYVNANVFLSIGRMDCKDYILLSDGLWTGPLRIQCGRLHLLNSGELVGLAICPYLSMCNHACEDMFAIRMSGRNMYAFALDDVRAGAEVTLCYSPDYRNSQRQSRRDGLKESFNFECECAKCERAHPDADYRKFHRYRCENRKCRQVFVPHLPQEKTLKWWGKDSINGEKVSIKCTVCGVEQSFEWLDRMKNLFGQMRNPTARRLLYRRFEEVDNWLLDQHELKVFLAKTVIAHWFAVNEAGGSRLTDTELIILLRIAKFVLSSIETHYSIFSLQYAWNMVFLWDLIALGKYRCTRDEFQPMLRAVDILSDEFQTVFMNYYADYIEPLLLP